MSLSRVVDLMASRETERERERSRHMDASVVKFEVCIIYIFTFYHN